MGFCLQRDSLACLTASWFERPMLTPAGWLVCLNGGSHVVVLAGLELTAWTSLSLYMHLLPEGQD